jgi:hypothetical protein
MALPFIFVQSEMSFPDLIPCAAKYSSLVRIVLAKARLCGCNLYYPSDILVAEDPVKSSDKARCYQSISLDSRSDGAEYEGDVKNISLASPSSTSIWGYYYDLGTETCKNLQSLASSADLIVVWGTAGVCEMNSFQSGQQALIQAVTSKPSTEKATMNVLPSRQILIWGDSTVEWFARFLDSDGEMQGDLVSSGFVSYQDRDSTMLRGLLGFYSSEVLANSFVKRNSIEGEFVYSLRMFEVEEEEEEEEEEEDDE